MAADTIEERLARDLEPCLSAPVDEVAPFGDGHSGFTYAIRLRGDDRRLVIRLSPPGARIAGPADIGRQGRIMSALDAVGLPVPRVIASSSDAAVDGRSFALMELVDGLSWQAAVERVGPATLTRSAVSFLRRLAELDPCFSGIGDDEPLQLEQELARWSVLLERAPDFVLADGVELRDRLADRLPAPAPAVLVHGDFHFGNLLFTEHGEIAAVVDWEIAELGHRLVDFGALALTRLRSRYAPDPNPTGDPGMPIGELAELAGVDDADAASAVAFSCFKYGAILGYNLGLHRAGKRNDPLYEDLVGTITGLLVDGSLILEHGLAAVEGDRA